MIRRTFLGRSITQLRTRLFLWSFLGNLDRHHMMRITSFGLNTALIHLDNGRAFGRHDSDDLSILAPIRQCCFFRSSTFSRLYRLSREGFSKLVAQSLSNDEILPTILIEEHFNALDRRLTILFSHLEKCIEKYSVSEVILDDGIDWIFLWYFCFFVVVFID